jgi:hypothetical protein
MMEPGSRKLRTLNPMLEVCGWSVMLVLGIWEVMRAPHHRGEFSAWFQIAVAMIAIMASFWRFRTGDR